MSTYVCSRIREHAALTITAAISSLPGCRMHPGSEELVLAQAFYDAQNRRRIRQRAGLIGLTEADHSFLIDDEHRPYRGATLLVPQVIRLRHLAFGMPIR